MMVNGDGGDLLGIYQDNYTRPWGPEHALGPGKLSLDKRPKTPTQTTIKQQNFDKLLPCSHFMS